MCVPPLRWLGTKAWAGSHVAPAPSTQPRPASWGSAELVLGELSRGPGHGVWESPLAMRVGWLPPPGPPRPAHLPLRAAAPKSCPCPGAALVLLEGREEWTPFLCQPEPPRCPPHGPDTAGPASAADEALWGNIEAAWPLGARAGQGAVPGARRLLRPTSRPWPQAGDTRLALEPLPRGEGDPARPCSASTNPGG